MRSVVIDRPGKDGQLVSRSNKAPVHAASLLSHPCVDLKVQFDFMSPRQVRLMFERHAAMLGVNPNLDQFANDLDRLDRLTAGDFATVARRAKICPIPDASALYRALDERARPIGFMQ